MERLEGSDMASWESWGGTAGSEEVGRWERCKGNEVAIRWERSRGVVKWQG